MEYSTVIKCDNLNLKQITDSGQCFRWREIAPSSFVIPSAGKVLFARQEGSELYFNCTREEFDGDWNHYFDMDSRAYSYEGIGKLILDSDDAYLKAAYEHGSGMRILNQDLWEMIVSFVISQNNNIKRIRNTIEAVCNKAALKSESQISSYIKNDEEIKIYRFPSFKDIDGDFFMDKSLGLGYRDTYLRDLYDYTSKDPGWIDELKTMDFDQAFRCLLSFKGIGAKVANCICLFGLHHVDAFPIDTHIRQILDRYYPDGFDFERYRGVAGIIQQYMFYYKISI